MRDNMEKEESLTQDKHLEFNLGFWQKLQNEHLLPKIVLGEGHPA